MIRKFLKSELFVILVLFIGAFAIRSIGIDWGLPSQQFPHSQFNQDETAELFGSLQLSEGIYQMGLLSYQPFFYYFSFIFFLLYFLFGLLTGQFTSLADFQLQYGLDLSQFFVVGRFFMVAVGAATVVLTYLVGKTLFGKRVGITAALFLLISFGHTIYSKIFLLDSFLPFMFLLAFFLIIRLKDAKPGKLRPYVLAGLAVAATATTKKTGFAMVVPFLLVPIIEGWVPLKWPPKLSGIDRRYPFGITIMLAALIALIGPYFVFLQAYKASIQSAAQGLVNDVARRFGASIITGNTYALSPYKWSLPWHLVSTLPNEMGITVYAMALLGFVLMAFDKEHRRVIIYLLITLAAFLIPIGVMVRAPWRDMLPVLPLLAISAGYGMVTLAGYLSRRFPEKDRKRSFRIVMTALILLVVIPPFVNLVRQQLLTLNTDTRDLAKEWIENNLPPDSQIAMEPFGPGILDIAYDDEISSSRQQAEESKPLQTMPRYDIEMVVDGTGSVLPPADVIPFLTEEGFDYVVVNSAFYGRFYNGAMDIHLPDLSQDGRHMHDVIESNLEFVVQFIPDWEKIPGPVIKIYHVPETLRAELSFVGDSFDPFPGMERPASAVGYYQFAPR